MKIRTVEWKAGRVVMLDQRLLPNREVYRIYDDPADVMNGIREMVVRGAPAIGVAAAMGIAMGARSLPPSALPASSSACAVHSQRRARRR